MWQHGNLSIFNTFVPRNRLIGNCFAYLLLFLRAQNQEIKRKVRTVFLHTVVGKIPVKDIQYNQHGITQLWIFFFCANMKSHQLLEELFP